MYNAYIVEVKEIREHSNADRLNIARIFDCNVIVDKSVQIGDKGIFFPVDGQLSEEYCRVNNLVRIKNDDGTYSGGYLDPAKRNVKAMNMRGERSEGLYMPLSSLESFGDVSILKVGDIITTFNGHEICCKYIPRGYHYNGHSNSNGKNNKKGAKKSKESYPYFTEHIDTPQLKYNPNIFNEGELIIMTEKVHGSSHRVGKCLVYKGFNLFDKIFKRNTRTYKYISGTRRTIRYRGKKGFYGNEEFRDKWDMFFEGKLQKGEVVYGEIVGAVEPNKPIMANGDNTKLRDKEIVKRYGKITQFSYGCDISKGENDFYIYRITKTDEDGNVIEYPYDYIKLRAEQMGAKVVPEFERFIYTTHEDMMERVNKYLEGCSTIDPSHTREGIVLRADRADKYKVAKIKSYIFSVLEGIIKEDAVEADIEEAQDL